MDKNTIQNNINRLNEHLKWLSAKIRLIQWIIFSYSNTKKARKKLMLYMKQRDKMLSQRTLLEKLQLN